MSLTGACPVSTVDWVNHRSAPGSPDAVVSSGELGNGDQNGRGLALWNGTFAPRPMEGSTTAGVAGMAAGVNVGQRQLRACDGDGTEMRA